jgi:hypothetical protein
MGTTTMRTRKRAVRMRDANGRDRTNEGPPMARTRRKGQQTRATTTKGKPDNLSTPLHRCEQGRSQVVDSNQGPNNSPSTCPCCCE